MTYLSLILSGDAVCTCWDPHRSSVCFHYTLLANVLHSSSQLILQELTFFCNLFTFLQKVLGSSLHGGCQNVGLLGASFLLVGWSLVAGVYQSGNL